MPPITPAGATIPGATHHRADVNGAQLHFVSAGSTGSPILLVHGWPETWWAFHKVIPMLAATHRVFAVDLRGFGDSSTADGSYDAVIANQSLHHVSNLEGLFAAIKDALSPQGRFITSDMIGRNGHMRWPEALDIIHDFWRQLQIGRASCRERVSPYV